MNANSPFCAVIELDVNVWGRDRAAEVVEQLVKALEATNTDDRGGHAIHHTVVGVSLRERDA